jgi:hypothetical protein
MSLMGTVLEIIVSVIIISPILWLVGRWLVGGAKAKFTDAIWIVVLGIIINVILGTYVLSGHRTIGFIVTLIVWVALIKHFFDAGWGKAIIIGVVAIIVLIVIVLVLAFLGFTAIAELVGGMGGLGLGGY